MEGSYILDITKERDQRSAVFSSIS